MLTRQGLHYKDFAGSKRCVFTFFSSKREGSCAMLSDKPLELAAYIGLDWADQHHDVALLEAGSRSIERRRVDHTPEALSAWIAELRRRFGRRPVGICLELSRGPLIYALLQYADFLVLYPVNPKSLKRFRETFAPGGSKDDPKDAELALELLAKHGDRLKAWKPDTPETRALQRLVEARRGAVDLRTQLTQQLRDTLKGYFPQALEWAGELSSRMACDFLLKWTALEAIQRSQRETVRRFYYGHGCRRGELIEKRIGEIQAAVPLTRDRAIIETSVLTVRMLVQQIRTLGPSITRYDEEIDKRFQAHPDAELFSSLPGAGAALAPRLLAAFGTDRERFDSATSLQQYSGIAPVIERSGKSTFIVRWRWAAPTFLRQSFHEFANQSIQQSRWARAFYELQRERGKGHHAAIRSLAFKWIRILWRCWQDRTPYDEAAYIQTLRQRGSPLVWRLHSAAA